MPKQKVFFVHNHSSVKIGSGVPRHLLLHLQPRARSTSPEWLTMAQWCRADNKSVWVLIRQTPLYISHWKPFNK